MQRKVEDVDTKNLPIGRELMMSVSSSNSKTINLRDGDKILPQSGSS